MTLQQLRFELLSREIRGFVQRTPKQELQELLVEDMKESLFRCFSSFLLLIL